MTSLDDRGHGQVPPTAFGPTTDDLPIDTPHSAARLRRWAQLVLIPVSVIGAALSYSSIYTAAVPTFGPVLAAGFPFLVDFLILGASLQYLAGAKVGRPRAGWRLTAHAGVAATLFLNALAADSLASLPWHVTAPAVWSVLVEMTAREVLGEWRAANRRPADRIPLVLWVSAPVESARTALHMMRTGSRSAVEARQAVGVNAAARAVMRRALPRCSGGARRTLRRQLRAGSMRPATVLRAVGWHPAFPAEVTKSEAVRSALVAVLLDTASEIDHSEIDHSPMAPADGPDRTPQDQPMAFELAEVARQRDELEDRCHRLAAELAQLDAELPGRHEAVLAELERSAERARVSQAHAEALAERLQQVEQARETLAGLVERVPLQVLDIARRMLDGDFSEADTGAHLAAQYGVSPRTGRQWVADAEQIVRVAAEDAYA